MDQLSNKRRKVFIQEQFSLISSLSLVRLHKLVMVNRRSCLLQATEYCHMLNATMCAVTRVICAIIELNQGRVCNRTRQKAKINP